MPFCEAQANPSIRPFHPTKTKTTLSKKPPPRLPVQKVFPCPLTTYACESQLVIELRPCPPFSVCWGDKRSFVYFRKPSLSQPLMWLNPLCICLAFLSCSLSLQKSCFPCRSSPSPPEEIRTRRKVTFVPVDAGGTMPAVCNSYKQTRCKCKCKCSANAPAMRCDAMHALPFHDMTLMSVNPCPSLPSPPQMILAMLILSWL